MYSTTVKNTWSAHQISTIERSMNALPVTIMNEFVSFISQYANLASPLLNFGRTNRLSIIGK